MKAFLSPAVRQRIDTLLAQTRGIKASVIATRAAVLFGVVSGGTSLGVLIVSLSGLVPGKAGAVTAGVGGAFAAVCTWCAAMGPKMTEAAGLCRQAEEGQTPFFDVLPQILQTLGSAKQITREAEAQALADAQAAERHRAQDAETASHAKLVTTLVAEIVPLLERTGSYKAGPDGLAEDGILAPAPADKVSAPAPDGVQAPVTGAEAAPETAASDAQEAAEAPEAAPEDQQGQARIVLDAQVVAGEAAAAAPKQDSVFPVVTVGPDGKPEVAS